METKLLTTMDIKGTYNIENAPDYIQYADAQKKSPFDEIVYHLTLFSQDFFSLGLKCL